MLRPRIVSVPSWLPSGTVNMVLLSAVLPEDDAPCHEEGATGYPDESIVSPPESCFGRNDGDEKVVGRNGAAGQTGYGEVPMAVVEKLASEAG